jgi:predicted nuclease of restriction endonuclease-like (RecB) superfamily
MKQSPAPGKSVSTAGTIVRSPLRAYFEPDWRLRKRGVGWCRASTYRKCKREDEREFYLRLACAQKWSSRELERQINSALFERVVLSPAKLTAPLRELHPDDASIFKDAYLVEFLDLPPQHSEADLQRALVERLKQFLIELGRDFCYVGSQYPIQVGGRDFSLDLLFFNRALN